MKQTFADFLQDFQPRVERSYRLLNQASWVLETTGHPDQQAVVADISTRHKLLFADRPTYEMLLAWQRGGEVTDPLQARMLDNLVRWFAGNMLPEELLRQISELEAKMSGIYATFRPLFEGQPVTENALKEVLRDEQDIERRIAAWQATKLIGVEMAGPLAEVVALRNEGAVHLGYPNYWEMRMENQEIDPAWLIQMLANLYDGYAPGHNQMLATVNAQLAERFGCGVADLGPWAWADPFCQEYPIGVADLDRLITAPGLDPMKAMLGFYQSIGYPLDEVAANSDLYPRDGKNQHGSCWDFDYNGDVRFLVNVKPDFYWFETMMHEGGHAWYDLFVNRELPWFLRTYSHIATTEAIAMLCGRQASSFTMLDEMTPLLYQNAEFEELMVLAGTAAKARQLIVAAWITHMVMFEQAMYANPTQDLNALWWEGVRKYQGITPPVGREGMHDYAAKMHIPLAPAYYQNYLIGELIASMLLDMVEEESKSRYLVQNPQGAQLITQRFIYPGDTMSWQALVKHATGKDFGPEAWLEEFA